MSFVVRRPMIRLRSGRMVTAVVVYASLVFVWHYATQDLASAAKLRFPSPSDVFAAFNQINTVGYAGATLLQHVEATLYRVIVGFAFASSLGIVTGIAMGLSKRFELVLNPLIQIVRPIPPLAWIPLALLWFGIDNTSKIFVAWLAVFTPAVINTYTGVRSTDQILVQAARVHGAKSVNVISRVVIPGALPMIFTGLRLSLQVSWMAVVASELVGAYTGLGHVMIMASRDLASPMIVVGMMSVVVLGFASTLLLTLAERWVIRWR